MLLVEKYLCRFDTFRVVNKSEVDQLWGLALPKCVDVGLVHRLQQLISGTALLTAARNTWIVHAGHVCHCLSTGTLSLAVTRDVHLHSSTEARASSSKSSFGDSCSDSISLEMQVVKWLCAGSAGSAAKWICKKGDHDKSHRRVHEYPLQQRLAYLEEGCVRVFEVTLH